MVIGIGGISNAGKSSLARRIKTHFSSKKIIILCQDDFAFPNDKIPKIHDHIDWECPESINFEYFEKAVLERNLLIETVCLQSLAPIFFFVL